MYPNYFNHSTIRKIITVFGTIFNDIKVQRHDSAGVEADNFVVPIAYGPKRHYITKLKEQSERSHTNAAITLPRMSYEFTSLIYDVGRQKNPQRYQSQAGVSSDLRYKLQAGAPYKLGLDLNIWAKNTSDALEIVEQILPFFQPNISITINDTETIQNLKDINFALSSVNVPIDYEGDVGNDRIIQWTLNFDADIFIYPPVSEQRSVKKAITNIIDSNVNKDLERFTFSINPPSAAQEDVYVVDKLVELL